MCVDLCLFSNVAGLCGDGSRSRNRSQRLTMEYNHLAMGYFFLLTKIVKILPATLDWQHCTSQFDDGKCTASFLAIGALILALLVSIARTLFSDKSTFTRGRAATAIGLDFFFISVDAVTVVVLSTSQTIGASLANDLVVPNSQKVIGFVDLVKASTVEKTIPAGLFFVILLICLADAGFHISDMSYVVDQRGRTFSGFALFIILSILSSVFWCVGWIITTALEHTDPHEAWVTSVVLYYSITAFAVFVLFEYGRNKGYQDPTMVGIVFGGFVLATLNALSGITGLSGMSMGGDLEQTRYSYAVARFITIVVVPLVVGSIGYGIGYYLADDD